MDWLSPMLLGHTFGIEMTSLSAKLRCMLPPHDQHSRGFCNSAHGACSRHLCGWGGMLCISMHTTELWDLDIRREGPYPTLLPESEVPLISLSEEQSGGPLLS